MASTSPKQPSSPGGPGKEEQKEPSISDLKKIAQNSDAPEDKLQAAAAQAEAADFQISKLDLDEPAANSTLRSKLREANN